MNKIIKNLLIVTVVIISLLVALTVLTGIGYFEIEEKFYPYLIHSHDAPFTDWSEERGSAVMRHYLEKNPDASGLMLVFLRLVDLRTNEKGFGHMPEITDDTIVAVQYVKIHSNGDHYPPEPACSFKKDLKECQFAFPLGKGESVGYISKIFPGEKFEGVEKLSSHIKVEMIYTFSHPFT